MTATQKDKTLYYEGIGRRKSAIARVRIFQLKSKKEAKFLVNEKSIFEYFLAEKLQKVAEEVFKKLKIQEHFLISAKTEGGGIGAQAQALRLGLARALERFNPTLRPELKKLAFLTRDPRRKERKKPGLHGARRAQQWSKR